MFFSKTDRALGFLLPIVFRLGVLCHPYTSLFYPCRRGIFNAVFYFFALNVIKCYRRAFIVNVLYELCTFSSYSSKYNYVNVAQ